MTGLFAGAFVGATYGAAAGALFGSITGCGALDSQAAVDLVGLFVELIVAGAIAGTIWGAILGTMAGGLVGLLAGIGHDHVSRGLPVISTLISIVVSIGVTTLLLGGWSAARSANVTETTSLVPQLIGVALTAVAGGMGGFTLGRGLLRMQSEPAGRN